MHVLCDTCSVLMLLRIAPDMFTDPSYECMMTQTVYQEFIQTQKFKNKYPWRGTYRQHLKSVSQGDLDDAGYGLKLNIIKTINNTAIRVSTGRRYNLSRADTEVAAATVCLAAKITTGDINLAAFLADQFDIECISALGLVNLWLEKEILTWNNDRQAIIEEWISLGERPQPKKDIRRFERLTGCDYPHG